MIVTLPSSENSERLLVRSDLPDPLTARREVESWAAARGLRIPRMALRLRVQSVEAPTHEWVVLSRPAEALPPTEAAPTPQRFATRASAPRSGPLPDFLRLVSGAA